MMINMKVLIIIVNYNGLNLLKKHMGSVLKTEYSNYDVLVVDNGSEDESVKYLKDTYPKVKIVESDENLGFGRGNNLGVYKYPEYDAYVFLNNDMSVESNWLGELIKVVKENVGAVVLRFFTLKREMVKIL